MICLIRIEINALPSWWWSMRELSLLHPNLGGGVSSAAEIRAGRAIMQMWVILPVKVSLYSTVL